MSNTRLEALGAGRFRVSGVLNADTVIALLRQSRELFAGASRVELDLSAVAESDSAGLALLLEWLRIGREAKQQIHYTNVPGQISAIARISEVDDLLTANGSGAAPQAPAPAGGDQPQLAPKTQTA